jgi:large conductance mechanosensitive channel
MGLLREFKAFAIKGNMVDMAVGIIVGAAFGKIVASLVGDIVMPVLGMAIGGVNLTDLAITLRQAEVVDGKQVAAVVVGVGRFLQTVFDFLIVACAIFMAVRAMNAMRRKEPAAPAAPAAPPRQEVLLQEIRDALRAGR